ncbi:hypothetical protein SAMN02787073_2774 [Chryseobacterium vrystaatense]|uniref:Uncharacterized protein n=2 Tax=Chryseobacterium vrystaatense TaxID=307480 RepID=A0A1M5E0K7_9FLAO|nr:hypothetical protein SAMN02787073_2774 [Chryseobacterium vrystaatense]
MNYMNILKVVTLSGGLVLALNSCTQKPAKDDQSVTGEQSAATQPATTKLMVDGSYANSDYEKRNEGYDWVGVIVENIDENKISVKIRSRADKKKPTCTLDTEATKVKDGVYQSMLNGKNVVFTFNETSVSIGTENPQDKDALHFYCSGGATIADTYTKTTAPLDAAQMGK